MDARYYKRISDKRLFFVRLNGSYGQNLDLDQQMYLGGDNGLRGYPLRYQAGDKRALLTIEQRFYTDWYPFRLFRVGAAVFYDMGRTWGEGLLGTGNDGLLKDVGAGLRLGNTRSSLGQVVHIDVAYPLDGNNDISNVQFIVEIKKSF
jgi:hemolysin activation/secretion protein